LSTVFFTQCDDFERRDQRLFFLKLLNSHDNAYKNVFSHPKAVQDLLRGFVHEEWVQQLDYTTLEKVSGSYVSDDLRDREDDIIWRIRMRAQTPAKRRAQGEDKTETAGEWLYVYLLLEFQSSNDPGWPCAS
jgi:predicted transposase YdaD